MIKCNSCGTNNLDTAQFCDECGRTLRESVSFEKGDIPQVQLASVTSLIDSLQNNIDVAPSASVTAFQNGNIEKPVSSPKTAKLVIEKGNFFGAEFIVSTNGSQIGRWDADNGIFPDIDLDKHDPEAKVSRKHARIVYDNGNYAIEDLGSTNGTFINRGRRLIPGTPLLLKDGDEIIVGKTFLRFHLT